VQKSAPIFDQINRVSLQIEQKRKEKTEAAIDLPELNKVITKIKAVIDKIKEKEKVYVDDKSHFSNKIILMKSKIDDKYSQIRILQSDKNILKEDFYS
jgi:chromosome segregation ATPase